MIGPMTRPKRPTVRKPRRSVCPLCGAASPGKTLAEATWAAPEVLARIAREHPAWRRKDGACPACVQEALLRTLLERGDAAFGVLPTPLHLHADPRYTGRGVVMAMVDS